MGKVIIQSGGGVVKQDVTVDFADEITEDEYNNLLKEMMEADDGQV